MLYAIATAVVALLILYVSFVLVRRSRKDVERENPLDAPRVDDVEFRTRSGESLRLDDLRGHVTLLVSIPTTSVDTLALKELATLEDRYETGQLEILAIPIGSEDRSGDDPAREAGRVPVLATVERHPLADRVGDDFGPVEEPYTKLLIDADGRVTARFAPATSAHSAELGRAVDEAIARVAEAR